MSQPGRLVWSVGVVGRSGQRMVPSWKVRQACRWKPALVALPQSSFPLEAGGGWVRWLCAIAASSSNLGTRHVAAFR